jgi:hypothetical protein
MREFQGTCCSRRDCGPLSGPRSCLTTPIDAHWTWVAPVRTGLADDQSSKHTRKG